MSNGKSNRAKPSMPPLEPTGRESRSNGSYVVVEGHSIVCGSAGILGPGEKITAAHLGEGKAGKDALSALVDAGRVVAK